MSKVYLEPLDTYILDVDYDEESNTTIKLFDQHQIQWFNHQSRHQLMNYFESVIYFYTRELEFHKVADYVFSNQDRLNHGYNYGILSPDDYALFREVQDEVEEEQMWIRKGHQLAKKRCIIRSLRGVLRRVDKNNNRRSA